MLLHTVPAKTLGLVRYPLVLTYLLHIHHLMRIWTLVQASPLDVLSSCPRYGEYGRCYMFSAMCTPLTVPNLSSGTKSNAHGSGSAGNITDITSRRQALHLPLHRRHLLDLTQPPGVVFCMDFSTICLIRADGWMRRRLSFTVSPASYGHGFGMARWIVEVAGW